MLQHEVDSVEHVHLHRVLGNAVLSGLRKLGLTNWRLRWNKAASRPCSPIARPRSLRPSSGLVAVSPAHGRPGEAQGTTQGPFHNDKVSHSQELRHAQLVARAAVLLGPTGLLGLEEGLGGALDGTTGCVPEHEDQPGVQRTGAELQAAKHAALGMRAGVASVAQDKEVPRKGIKDSFQGHARICTANQSSVGSLAHLVQIRTHALVDLASCGGTHCEALIAILQHGQGMLWHHWLTLGSSDWAALDGRRHGALGGQQLGLLRRAAQELHSARLEVIDAALDLQVPFTHQVAQWLRELQEEVHGVEDVHLHRVSDELGLLDPLAQVLAGLLRHSSQALQETLQGTARCLGLSGLESLRSSGHGATLRVPQHQDQLGAQLAGAELQAANNAPFCLSNNAKFAIARAYF